YTRSYFIRDSGGRHGERSDARTERKEETEGRQGQAEAGLCLQAGADRRQLHHERARRQEGLTVTAGAPPLDGGRSETGRALLLDRAAGDTAVVRQCLGRLTHFGAGQQL